MNNHTPAGKVIMNHLVSRNLSIKDLSELCNISYSHLTSMMRGERSIDKKHIVKIADALRFSREQREEFRETAFISNRKITLDNEKGDIPYYILKLIYALIKRRHNISRDMVKECLVTIGYIKADPNERLFFE